MKNKYLILIKIIKKKEKKKSGKVYTVQVYNNTYLSI